VRRPQPHEVGHPLPLRGVRREPGPDHQRPHRVRDDPERGIGGDIAPGLERPLETLREIGPGELVAQLTPVGNLNGAGIKPQPCQLLPPRAKGGTGVGVAVDEEDGRVEHSRKDISWSAGR